MGLEFDKLPINTLVGADWKTFKAVTANRTIDKGFRKKYFLTKSVCLVRCNRLKMHAIVRLPTSRWKWTRYLSSGIGAAGRHSCTMSFHAISISVITRRIRPYSRT